MALATSVDCGTIKYVAETIIADSLTSGYEEVDLGGTIPKGSKMVLLRVRGTIDSYWSATVSFSYDGSTEWLEVGIRAETGGSGVHHNYQQVLVPVVDESFWYDSQSCTVINIRLIGYSI